MPRADGAPPPARPLVLDGTLQRVRGADTTGLGGVWVVAHRIGEAEGPIDSQRTGPAGRFRFRIASADHRAIYLVSARWQGIGYFSLPVPGASDSAPAVSLTVYDTASSGGALSVAMRHLVVGRLPEGGGARRVLDIVEVLNPDPATRVGADSAAVVWAMRLPDGIAEATVGEGDISPTAVRFAGDTALVAAPFPPGTKQVVITYLVPRDARSLVVPIDQPTGRLEVLFEDTLGVGAEGLTVQPAFALEGRSFTRYGADRLGAGDAPVLRLASRWPALLRMRATTWLGVFAAAAVIAFGFVAALRRRPAPLEAPAERAAPGGRDALLAQIVALDERYAGRETETPAAEWQAYQERRARLKAALALHVASG